MDIPGVWKQKDRDDKEGDEEGETSNSSSIAKKENIKAKEKLKLVSLNPLPPESLVFRSSSEREKSSDPTTINDDETDSGASSNADVEDNLEVNTNQCLSAQLNSPLKV